MGAVSGQGLGDLIRDDFGIRWTFFAMAVLLIANGANIVAEFAGAAAALEIFGIPAGHGSVVAAGIWALVVFGSYRIVERVFLSVAVVFVAYIASAFFAGPDWGAVGQGLVTPSISFDPDALLLMVAMVGTTVTPYMFFYLQSSVADKGLGPEELSLERADAVLGGIWTNVIALFIVVVTAATLFGTGLHSRARRRPRAPSPRWRALRQGALRGRPLRRIGPGGDHHAAHDQLHGLRVVRLGVGVSRRFSEAPVFMGLYTALIVLGALVVLMPGLPLIGVILVSQNLNGILLPIILIFMLRLVNNPRIMGRHMNPAWLNISPMG